MVNYALKEGLSEAVLEDLPVPASAMNDLQAVPADYFFQ